MAGTYNSSHTGAEIDAMVNGKAAKYGLATGQTADAQSNIVGGGHYSVGAYNNCFVGGTHNAAVKSDMTASEKDLLINTGGINEAVINIKSGGPEGKEREFGLTWSSDSPSVRKPYIRKAHIPEDDVVFGDAEPSGDGVADLSLGGGTIGVSGTSTVRLHVLQDEVMPLEVLDINLDADKLSIYVPANLVDDYKAATGWSDYADVIFAEPEEEETQEETPGEP